MSTDSGEPTTLVQIFRAEFAFLVEHGFRPMTESPNSVRYENIDGVFVRVFRDPRDKYVGFRVGHASRPKDALTATELAKLEGVAIARADFPERADQVHASVARVAHLLRAHGRRALSGDESIYAEAQALRSAYTQPFTRPPSSGGATGAG